MGSANHLAASLPRLTRWLLVLAAFGAAIYLTHAITGFGGETTDTLVGGVVYNATMLVAALGIGVAAMARGRDRLAWMTIALGALSWALGDLTYSLFVAGLPNEPYPSLSDPLYLASYPLFYIGLGLLLRSQIRGLTASTWLDGLIAGLGVATVAAALMVDPIVDSTGGSTAAVATNIGYPIGDLVLLSLAVVALGVTGWRPGRMWALLTVSVIANAAGDVLYLRQVALDTYVGGGWIDALWPLSLILMLIAARTPIAAGSRRRFDGWRLLVVPAIATMAAAAILFYDHGGVEINLTARLLGLTTLAVAALRVALAFKESLHRLRESELLALTDPLTGLGNRRLLFEDLEESLMTATADDPRLLVMYDLNGFKQYNDSFGHPAGDSLLARLSQKLDEAAAPFGRAYRMGGDEFCLLLTPGTTPTAAIIEASDSALTESGDRFEVTAARGMALLPSEAADSSSALQLVDRRLYGDKDGRPSSARRQLRGVLLQTLQEREPDLRDHVQGVAELAASIGRRLGMTTDDLDVLTRAAELHDIGKMAIPDAILVKPGPLDDEELDFMRRHTILGERILAAAPAMKPVAELVRSSHERWDGTGYPDGLAGNEIPLGSRVIFVCDAYDAMTSHRTYRRASDHEHAIAELRSGAGSQFDPEVVSIFCEEVRRARGERAADPAGASAAA